jgi:sigma-E factor negative regulatory protein RseB
MVPLLAMGQAPAQWLERMAQAVELLNYEGTFIHMHDGSVESLYIIHRNDAGKVSERIVSMDGAGREIIRHENEVTCILPDERSVLIEQRKQANPLLGALPNYTDRLERHYSVTLFRRSRVAGRMTRVVGIKPRDSFRYGYRLWLDEATAMPLKSQMKDDNDEIVEQILFTSIAMPESIPPSALEPTIDTRGFTWFRPPVDEETPVGQSVGWRAATVPSGFELSASSVRAMAGSDYPVEHLVYSDGLAAVSVFIEDPKTRAEPMTGFARMGSANAFSLRLSGRQVTAVGEVPRRTVESIATSLTRINESSEP